MLCLLAGIAWVLMFRSLSTAQPQNFMTRRKQKYEIMANTFKSLDDVINLYCELHERYPGIIAIVDGVRSPDREGWKKLNQRIGEKVLYSWQ
ncbi:Enolase member 4 [Desmophyllum pertusum]|uniref:phosphopyruvate hydratase n=1 Tax=Desmophyllum pertusum TaxID=174260 RepID=A0A9X0CIT4_9CNID|nr:Enolase member 4 [Desmophyllum pertusum]